jgi:hypothetical protein
MRSSAGGFVALTWKGHNESSRVGHSGSKTEELVHKTDLAAYAALRQALMAATDHAYHLESVDGSEGYCYPLEAARRPDDELERSMVGPNDVIQVFRCWLLNIFR